MKLLLIRHGDPDYANDTLTDKGHRQAELLAESLLQIPIDRLFVSPLGRARHTADYLIHLKKLDFEILEFLKELDGRYTDTLYAWEYHGCDLLEPDRDITKTNWPNQVPYGNHMGPVSQQFIAQFDDFISDFGLERAGHVYKIHRSSDETLAFACHAGIIMTLLSHLLHIPPPVVYSQFFIDPSSVTRLQLETKDNLGIFRLTSLNDMSHTASLARRA